VASSKKKRRSCPVCWSVSTERAHTTCIDNRNVRTPSLLILGPFRMRSINTTSGPINNWRASSELHGWKAGEKFRCPSGLIPCMSAEWDGLQCGSTTATVSSCTPNVAITTWTRISLKYEVGPRVKIPRTGFKWNCVKNPMMSTPKNLSCTKISTPKNYPVSVPPNLFQIIL
jgi:hypothetical protein